MNPLPYLPFDSLAYPWLLLLIIPVVLLLLIEWTAGAAGAVVVSTGSTLARIKSHRRLLLRHIPPLLRAVGMSLLIVALAGPLTGYQIRKDRANVIDIMLAVDVSGSMAQEDFISGGQPRNRLYVTKEAVRDFIESRKARVEDRYGLDRLGLITYAGFAWTACPLTLDYGLLERELDDARVVTEQRKDGTAIGSAIGLAVRRLSQSETKSKVIVLLTDGLNNRGDLDPITAANIAKDYGMRVYTIGAGSTETGFMRGNSLFSIAQRRNPIDEDVMREIADITGAKYFRATNLESLQEAYAEINALETTEVEVGDYYEFKNNFMPWALAGAIFVLLSLFLRRGWFEVIP
jgi:Ca-activated chloride channel family protein